MDEGTRSTVLGTFRKAPSLVGANVVTDIKKIDCTAQGYGSCIWTDWFRHERTRYLIGCDNILAQLHTKHPEYYE